MMHNAKRYFCVRFHTYLGFENVSHWPPYFSPQSFFDTLPSDLLEIINGRLYEKEKTPPYQYLLGE